MNVLQWPETSTPSITSFSWVFRFSGRISESSWMGMVSPSPRAPRLRQRRGVQFLDDHGRAVRGLEARAAVPGDAVQAEQAMHVRHGRFDVGEVGAQVAAALLVDVARVDVRGE